MPVRSIAGRISLSLPGPLSFLAVLSLLAGAAACAPKKVDLPDPTAASRSSPISCFLASPGGLGTPPRRNGTTPPGSGYRQATCARRNATSTQRCSSMPQFYPAEAGLGYVGLARKNSDGAVTHFDNAVVMNPRYVPALVGRGEALLSLGDRDQALKSFEAAVASDADLSAAPQPHRGPPVQRAAGRRHRGEEGRGEWRSGRGPRRLSARDCRITAKPVSSARARAGRATREQSPARCRARPEGDRAGTDRRAHADRPRGALRSAGRYSSRPSRPMKMLSQSRSSRPTDREAYRRASRQAAARGPARRVPLIPIAPRVSRAQSRGAASGSGSTTDQTRATAESGRHHRHPRALGGPLDPGRDAHRGDGGVSEPHLPAGAVVRRSDLAQAASRFLTILARGKPALGASLEELVGRRFLDVSPGHPAYAAVSLVVEAGVMRPGRGWQLSARASGHRSRSGRGGRRNSKNWPRARPDEPHGR